MGDYNIYILLSYLTTGTIFSVMTFLAILKNIRLKKNLQALEISKEE